MIIFQKYLSAEVGYIYTISINERIKRIKLIDCFVLQVVECLAFHSSITFLSSGTGASIVPNVGWLVGP